MYSNLALDHRLPFWLCIHLLLGECWVLICHEGKLAAVWTIGLPAEPVLDAAFMEGVETLQGKGGACVKRLKADRT